MAANPLQPIEENDSKLFEFVQQGRDLAFEQGALSKKDKLLIALAIDVTHSAVNGIRSLALQALEAGATKEEITETLRVCAYISGAGCIYSAAAGLKDVL